MAEKESFESLNPEKRESWRKMLDHVERMVDGLGKRVDPGIKETVAIVNCMELATNGSCEGHLDGQSKAPWIHFEFIPAQLKQEIRQARLNLGQGEKTSPQLDALIEEARLKLLGGEARILNLLDEFYGGRRGPAETRLGITFYPDSARLVSQGAKLQDLYPPEIQVRKLRAYQEEMGAFAEFLKTKFLSGN
jgi:hypothetical protein